MNRVLAAFFIVLLVSSAESGFVFWSMGKPWFWKRAIRRFEKSDLAHPPKPGVIVFTGSSSINFWKGLSHDMAPLNVLNRGFGGSQWHMLSITLRGSFCPVFLAALWFTRVRTILRGRGRKVPKLYCAIFRNSWIWCRDNCRPHGFIYQ